MASRTATITVTTEDGGFAATCEITVEPYIAVTGVVLSVSNDSFRVGQPYCMTAFIQSPNAANQNIIWTNSNSSVVALSANGKRGKMVSLSPDVACITAITEDGGYSKTCTVTVLP